MEWIGNRPSVLGAGAFQHALIEVIVLAGLASEFGCTENLDCGGQGLRGLRSLKAREREVRVEGALFGRNAQRFEFHFDGGYEGRELRAPFDACPENARAARAGEKSQASEAQFDWRKAGKVAERVAYAFDVFRRNLADKFERNMHAFQAYPPRAGTSFLQPLAEPGQRRAHRLGNIQSHKEPHAIPALRSVPRWAMKAYRGGHR